MTEVLDKVRPKFAKQHAHTQKPGPAPTSQASPYEQARKRLDSLNDPEAAPKPPAEVLALKSTRALDEWEDLMLVQDVELWGAIDLSVAAQLVCLQEFARDMQFEVQVVGRVNEMDRWGNMHPSVQYRMWTQTLQQINRLRASIGFNGAAREKSMADANRRAKRAIRTGTEAIKKAAATTPAPDVPLAGTDITA